jgi:hypothetical protein
MKFLTIATVKDVFRSLPQADQKRLWEENVQWTVDLKKKMGDKFNLYAEVGWGRLVSISEYNSVEEYSQSLESPPMAQAGLINYESYPLIEVDEKTLDAWTESLKAAK